LDPQLQNELHEIFSDQVKALSEDTSATLGGAVWELEFRSKNMLLIGGLEHEFYYSIY
jgi:hypothetical protein